MKQDLLSCREDKHVIQMMQRDLDVAYVTDGLFGGDVSLFANERAR
jgi:hypothetical protein